MTTVTVRSVGSLLTPERIATWALVLFTEFLLVAAYLAVAPTRIEMLRYVLYPFVWINVGVASVMALDVSAGNRKHRIVGGTVALAYLVVLLYTANNIGTNPPTAAWSWRIGSATPGWGPILIATGPWFRITAIPFEVVGYTALAYLLYGNVLRISRSVFAGALGLVTCVGCTVPILAPFIGLLGGPASSLTTMAYRYSYDLGTLLFVVTVAILYLSAAGALPDRATLRQKGRS